MSFEFREAVAADVPGLFTVRTAVRENVLSRAEMEEMGITESSVCAMIEESRCAWVAIDAGEIVGFSMIIPEEACLFAAFTLPSHEGRGIGRQLVALAEEALFAQHDTLWLETAAHTRAARFYHCLGWSQPTDIGNGDIRLTKRRKA